MKLFKQKHICFVINTVCLVILLSDDRVCTDCYHLFNEASMHSKASKHRHESAACESDKQITFLPSSAAALAPHSDRGGILMCAWCQIFPSLLFLFLETLVANIDWTRRSGGEGGGGEPTKNPSLDPTEWREYRKHTGTLFGKEIKENSERDKMDFNKFFFRSSHKKSS